MPADLACTGLDDAVHQFYLHALELMDRSKAAYVVGGGYAMACYSGIVRHTKDLDVFVKPPDRDRVLDVFRSAGYRTELTWPHFLAKALKDDAFVDVIYSSANGLCPVDDLMLGHARDAQVLGRTVPLCPAEEMIWSKAFVQSRDRFDGADIMHLLLAEARKLDWRRLRDRFRGHEAVLLAHLIMFDYVYPSERGAVPSWVMQDLRQAAEQDAPAQRLCRGTFLSNDQYCHDVTRCGYLDARLKPRGPMTPQDVLNISPPDSDCARGSRR